MMDLKIVWPKSHRFLRNRPWVLPLLLSVVVGGTVFFEIFLRKERSIREPRYLIVTRDLKMGHPLSVIDFHFGYLAGAKAGTLTDQDLHLLKGAYLAKNLSKNSPLMLDSIHLSPSITGLGVSIPKGLRAYTIEISDSIEVGPGDRVDIYSSPNSVLPGVLVSGALVLYSTSKGNDRFIVIVSVHPREISVLEKALKWGKLKITLRHPEDRDKGEKFLEAHSTQHRRKRVDILMD